MAVSRDRDDMRGAQKRRKEQDFDEEIDESLAEMQDLDSEFQDPKKKLKSAKKAAIQQQQQPRQDFQDDDDEELWDERKSDEKEGGKRRINKEIEGNRGLTKNRDKKYRNSRSKHKQKYSQALHKLGQSQKRSGGGRYGGESTGVTTKVVRSRSFAH